MHENIKTLYKHIISSINRASAALPVSKFNPHTKRYWNAAVKEAHSAQRVCRKQWLKEGKSTGPTSEAHKSYRAAKFHFKKVQKNAISKCNTEFYNELNTSATCNFGALCDANKVKKRA